jgi:hypothetical protein
MYMPTSLIVSLKGLAARIRRDVAVYAVCAVCGMVALSLAVWSSVLALVPLVGAVYAPLIVAGFFVLVILLSIGWLQIAKSHRKATTATPFGLSEPTHRQAQFAQVAMIVEAMMLGYALSRRSNRR